MNWFGPEDDCGCCCDPPTVTCSATNGVLTYSVSDAVQAELRIWCPTRDDGPPDETVQLILSDGAVSGTHNYDTECVICVWAENACGVTECCRICRLPCCNETSPATSNPGNGCDGGARDLDSQAWILGSANHPHVPAGYYGRFWQAYPCTQDGQAITSVLLNGVEQFPALSGWIVVPLGSGPEYWDLVVTNACGNTHTCRFWPPCCYRMNSRSYEIRNAAAEYYAICSAFSANPAEQNKATHTEMWVRGLDTINGTHVDAIDWQLSDAYPFCGYCFGDGVVIGSGEIEWKQTDVRQDNSEVVYSWKVSGNFFMQPQTNDPNKSHSIVLIGNTRTYTPAPGQPTITEADDRIHLVAEHALSYTPCDDRICEGTTGFCWWQVLPQIRRVPTPLVLDVPCNYNRGNFLFGAQTWTCNTCDLADAIMGYFEVRETVYQ